MKPGVSRRLKVFVVIAVILSVGLTSVARAEDRRWIVIFLEGTDLRSSKSCFLRLGGIKVVHTLSFINALAIELPLGDTLDDPAGIPAGEARGGSFR